jgi:hypothetical protein
LDGLDIDVEQPMSQAGIERLIDRLHYDFGPSFIISLAPVASALKGGRNLSGFNYGHLESRKGCKIDFYNGQFYNGFGSMTTTADYDDIVSNGFKPSRVVAGQFVYPGDSKDLYSQLNATVDSLRKTYGQIGGIAGWEYFDNVAGTTEP